MTFVPIYIGEQEGYGHQYYRKKRKWLRLQHDANLGYDEKDVEELNRLFMLNSYAEIYYRKNEEEWLRKNVGEKVTEEKDEWVLGNPQIGYLQKVSRRSVYDIVKLPMFKINAFFKTAPLPYSDEAGPLRKAVYEKMDEDIKI